MFLRAYPTPDALPGASLRPTSLYLARRRMQKGLHVGSVKSWRRRTYWRSVFELVWRMDLRLVYERLSGRCKSCGAILNHVRHDIPFYFLGILMCLQGVFREKWEKNWATFEWIDAYRGTCGPHLLRLLTLKDWREFRSKHAWTEQELMNNGDAYACGISQSWRTTANFNNSREERNRENLDMVKVTTSVGYTVYNKNDKLERWQLTSKSIYITSPQFSAWACILSWLPRTNSLDFCW